MRCDRAPMFDSTFSPILAQFQDEEPIPYADDEPILPKEEIAEALDSREDRYTGLLTTVGYNSTDQWWKKVEPALEKGDRAFIEKNPWQLSGNFQGLLQGLWNDTWDAGCFHAVKGLNIANQQAADVSEAGRSPGNFSRAEFADYPLPDYPQEPFYTAYPPDYGYPLRKTDLQSAVEQRTLFLANDVNEKTRDRIQASVMNAVSAQGVGGIPKRDRVKLLQQINLALGRQSLAEIKDPDVAIGEKLVRTTLRVPGTQTFRSRAKTIAATEISAAYSLGRLQVYTQAGVKRVRWQTLEDLRVCKLCRTRNGIVIEADVLLAQHQFAFRQRIDPTQLVIPCHANDRCFFVALVERRKKDQDMVADPGRNLENRQVEPLKGGWNVLKNVIGTTVAIASAARAIQRGVEDIQRQQLARQQEEERQKQEQARRLARAIMVTGGAALSLGVLYMIMRGQAQRTQQQVRQAGGVTQTQPSGLGQQMLEQVGSELDRARQVEAVKNSPVTPAEVLTEPEQQSTLSKLPAGLDLRLVNDTSLRTIYGLTIGEAAMVEELRKQYERDRVIPPEQALVPQFFLPPNFLEQLPGLKQVEDLRNVSLQDLGRMILRARGEIQPQQAQGAIERQVQSILGIPPARTDGPPGELTVGGVNLNTATVAEIARLLPAGMSLQRRTAIAQNIYNSLRRMSALGTPITDLEELAAIPGVGKVTVRNLQARNYTQNLNNLLLQAGDADAANLVASILDIGPKLAETVVREYRASGQFGKPGVDPAEDLIERLARRVEQEGRLFLSDEVKNRIRERLAGRMYVMPIPPTQPVGGVQPQGVGGALPPATSPLNVPSPGQPFTPTIPGTTPPMGQLPASTAGGAPIITPVTTVGFPTRAQPVINNGRIIVPSAEENQKRRRDSALNDYARSVEQVSDYQNELTKFVNNAKMPKQGIFGGGLKLDKYKNQLFKNTQKSVSNAIAGASGTEINAAALNQMADSAERNIGDVENRLIDIDDPLADPLFKQNGRLTREVQDKIQSARNSITQGLKTISDGLKLPDKLREDLQKRKDELLGLRSRVQTVIGEALNVGLRPTRSHLMQGLDSQIAALGRLTPEQLGSYYGEIRQLIGRLNELKVQVVDADASDVIASIDGQIAAVDEVLQNAQNLKRPELVNYLNGVGDRFDGLQQRLNNLPQTFDELAPPQQDGFVGASATRDRIRGTTLGLERNVSALQRRITRSRKYLDDSLEEYNNTIAPLRTPPGETIYERDRRLGMEYAQNIINLGVQGIDEQLQVLRNLADPVTGMASVMSSLTQTEALQDLPSLPSAPMTPGLASPPPPAQPKDEVRGRFLDDAVRQRREAINRAAARITSNATLQSGFPYGFVQRIELVINPDNGGSVPLPESVTRSRLNQVERLLDSFTVERNQTTVEIQELANVVAGDMEGLRQLDPVAYQELQRSPTWAIIRQLRVGAANQVEEYDARATILQNARAKLLADLQQPTRFEYRGQQLRAEDVRARMNEVRQEVGRLIARRRDDLTPIWSKLAPLTTADSKGIEQVYRGERTPTAGEQDFINGLDETQQKTLKDAATTGALDAYRRRVRLLVKEQELEGRKLELWGDPNNPEKLRGRQVPKTIQKNLERFNQRMRKKVGMKIVLIPNPTQGRIDYEVRDLFDASASNYEAEPGFKDYEYDPNVRRDLRRARRKVLADGLILEFEELPWVKETLGMLIDEQTTTLNWRKYVAQVEEGKVTSEAPSNYIEVITALELLRARRVQVESEMEVVGFKRRQTLAAFNRSKRRRDRV